MRHSPSKLAVLHGGLGARRATATRSEELPSEVLVHQTTKTKNYNFSKKNIFSKKERQGGRPNMEKNMAQHLFDLGFVLLWKFDLQGPQGGNTE